MNRESIIQRRRELILESELAERIKNFFIKTDQPTWGKHQIVEKIKDIEIEYLKEKIWNGE